MHQNHSTAGVEIHLTLNLDEVNTALAAMAKQPYEAVSGAIEKIRAQTIPQVNAYAAGVAARAERKGPSLSVVEQPAAEPAAAADPAR